MKLVSPESVEKYRNIPYNKKLVQAQVVRKINYHIQSHAICIFFEIL